MSFGRFPTAGILTAGGLSVPSVLASPAVQALSETPARITGTGLVARFSPIKGVTPKSALNRRIWLPAFLDPFTVDETANHAEYDTLSAGHFSQAAQGPPGARNFRTTTLDAIVVGFDAPWLVATGQDPKGVRTALFEVLRARKPVLLVVHFNPNAGRGVELYMYCTFRRISKDVRAGELETRYLTIELSEWRDPSVARRGSSPGRKKGATLPTTHILKASDTLSGLSFEYYGRYDRWRWIREANGIPAQFGAKTPLVNLPGRWKVGYKVKVPAGPIARMA